MILIRFTGGLGNQMFQYALGTNLALRNKTELRIDTTLLLDRSQPHEVVTHRNLDLGIFRVNLNEATQEDIWRFNGKPYSHLPGKIGNKILWELGRKRNLIVEKKRNFQPEILRLTDNKCLVGAWQSEKYFEGAEEEIRKQYAFKDPLPREIGKLADAISGQRSVCINVRRGDYVTSPVYSKILGAMPLDYYIKACEILSSRIEPEHIYIFSDDMAWCRENLKFNIPFTFMDYGPCGSSPCIDLHLMTLCKHFIISNSTFGWWAAWLGNHPGKMVIAPKRWFKDTTIDSSDLVPDRWTRI